MPSLGHQLNEIEELKRQAPYSKKFFIWKANTEVLLQKNSIASRYYQDFLKLNFADAVGQERIPNFQKDKLFQAQLEKARFIIEEACKEQHEETPSSNVPNQPLELIEQLCRRFPLIARQVCKAYRNRELFQVKDEYDVQHLLHSLLLLHFDDVRPEEVNPSRAGATSRVDFLIKTEKIAIEVKKTRAGLKDKELGEQLIIDIERYQSNPDCEALICFTYDPDHIISNPTGLENDLSKSYNGLAVKLIIAS